MPGIFEVMVGASLFYVDQSGAFALQGDLIDLDKRVNISDARRADARKNVFASLDRKDVIEFLPEGRDIRAKLYVYTDIDCGYCRKLHLEVPALNDAGIAVAYLAFPRSGPEGESFEKAAAVWCAKDRRQALTAAKAGKKVSSAKCENPVAAQFELGRSMGVGGTPAVYTESGAELGGYVPAKTLIKLVDDGRI